MLPGNATLRVQSLPFVGWKIAVGLEVSTATGCVSTGFVVPFVLEGMMEGAALASDWRFRFCQLELVNIKHMIVIKIYHRVSFSSTHLEFGVAIFGRFLVKFGIQSSQNKKNPWQNQSAKDTIGDKSDQI